MAAIAQNADATATLIDSLEYHAPRV